MSNVQPGISVLLQQRPELLRGRRVGVLTNHSGVLPDLTLSLETLLRSAAVRAIFSPEHGLDGVAGPGEKVGSSQHPSGVPIYSLYGEHLAPAAEQLDGLDLLVCDLQDVGTRFYTYVWTIVLLIEQAALRGVPVLVADRPNPIGGLAIEGPGVDEDQRTLVGLHDVAMRHGLTIGELCRLAVVERGLDCELTVVPCAGWHRGMLWSQTGLPWVAPSPNIPTAEMTLLYPGTCLLEGINVSVGRGTARPFEWLGAPWLDGQALARALNDLQLPGMRWRPHSFRPCAEPYAGQVCHGVQPHIGDAAALLPARAGLALVVEIHRQAGEQLQWRAPHFDRLAGSTRLRQAILQGAALEELTQSWPAYERNFSRRVRPVLEPAYGEPD